VALDNARLYDEARKAYHELKDAQQRIMRTEKMAVLGTFASGLAHEVRNPLNSIGLQLSLLERRIGRVEPGIGLEMSELTRIIREEVKRLDELVGDFLLFSRTDRLKYRPASLDAVVEEVIQLLGPEAGAARVRLERTTVGASLPSLQMDAEKIKQVVINLVRNAIEAMPRGGKLTLITRLSLNPLFAKVDLGAGQRIMAEVQVMDEGEGIPEAARAKLFTPFFTTKERGLGLGLALCHRILEEHRGAIQIASEPGRGTTVTCFVPIAR
jgi:signal transduction histidine kinase